MEGKDVKRRFVQSTLFPHKGNSVKEAENCPAGEGEEELCSSGKKRRKATNSKSKTTPRASAKKGIANGKQVDETGSVIPDKSNYFVKASEKVQQKGQESAVVIIDSADGADDICTPPSPAANGNGTPRKPRQRNSTPRKGKKNSTPNKNVKTGRRELFSGQIPFEIAGDDQQLAKIPDLRLEAKLAAEENSRIFSGKKLHPFFMSRKGGKANQDTTGLENACSPFGKKEVGIAFNPIHVFDNVENGQMALNWGHWMFSERSTSNNLDTAYPPIYEGSIDSLSFGNFLNNSRATRASLYENCLHCRSTEEKVYEELLHKPEPSFPNLALALPYGRMTNGESEKNPDFLSRYAESSFEDNKTGRNDQLMGMPYGERIDSDLQDKLLQERLRSSNFFPRCYFLSRTVSHYHACPSQTENCLWTDKYQPQNAKQICGNSEPVKFLSDWLGLWHKRGSLASKSCLNEDNLSGEAMNCDSLQSDSDYDSSDEEDGLKNVLLITGPVGSGKSAAIYACARDQGFQIIEVNTSDWRNGALVRQKFGEAVESHWLQRTAENATENKSQLKLSKAFNNEATNCSNNEVIELLDDDPQDAGAWSSLLISDKNGNANSQSETKTLILFEDIDATLGEDHGFITTIQQLAETAKRPMILTSNSVSPVLPKNLDRSELRFSLPLKEELLGLVHMICASEKAKIHTTVVERFINHSQNDIRKTIMLLQFWYQGQTLGKDHPRNVFPATHWSVLFDINAGHRTLPKLIYWDHPSKLSDLVEEEVGKSLILLEDSCSQVNMNSGKDQNGYNSEIALAPDLVPDPVEVKKKAMLRLHCSQDEIEGTQFEPNTELFDFSCSPIAPTQERTRRRKTNTVLSSDSEDDVIVTPDSAGVNINVESFDLNKLPTSHSFDQIHSQSSRLTFSSEEGRSEDFRTQVHGYSTGPTCQTEAYKPEDHWTQFSEHSTGPTYDTCYSQDISVVPESSYVPETEIINEEDLHSVTVSYGHFINKLGTTMVITDQDSIPIPEPCFDANSSKSLHIQETIEIASELKATYVGQEETGDSVFKFLADVPRGHQLLDECSRVDLMKAWKPLENLEADHTFDVVKDAWKKLYDRKNDLRQYVTVKEKSASRGLKLACGLTDLISKADMLLKGCQTLISDFSEPCMTPGEKFHSCGYYETQLEMSSILSQHGMCLYAKEIISHGTPASSNTSGLAADMLSFSTDSSALGKLASMDQENIARLDIDMAREFDCLTRSSKLDTCLSDVLQTVVPVRSHLTAKGRAFHEYVSTLSQISRIDSSRLSECPDNKMQRRGRTRRHYLNSGSLSLELDDITLLGRYNSYRQKA